MSICGFLLTGWFLAVTTFAKTVEVLMKGTGVQPYSYLAATFTGFV